jgi:membrane fusion protein (multidrug efflux system)
MLPIYHSGFKVHQASRGERSKHPSALEHNVSTKRDSFPFRTLRRFGPPALPALLALLAMGAAAGCSKAPPPAPQAPKVYVVEVTQKDVPIYQEQVGQTKGFQDVEVRARVEGYLEKVAFTEGTFVHKGDLLYQIDPKPFEAAMSNAEANLATAQARLQKTDNDVKRLGPLAEQQAVSQQELDNAVSSQEAARAQVNAQKATADNARLNLGYTHITSPIDGLVGTTQVKAGNLVGRGENTLLTTVSQIDPILFRAGISEADYLRLARQRAGEQAQGEAAGKTGAAEKTGAGEKAGAPEAGAVELVLADGTTHPYKGSLDSIERAVDPTTGTLAIQVRFPNTGGLVRPGQYGRARFVTDVKKGALLVPQRAVQELQNLFSLAVVGSDSKVTFRNVTPGPRVGSLWVIEKGVEPGERVVVEGLQRLKEGTTVNPIKVPVSPEGQQAAEPAADKKKPE